MATKKAAASKAATASKATTPKKATAPPKKSASGVKKDDAVTYVNAAGEESSAHVLAVHGGNRLDLVVSGPAPFTTGQVVHETAAKAGGAYWK